MSFAEVAGGRCSNQRTPSAKVMWPVVHSHVNAVLQTIWHATLAAHQATCEFASGFAILETDAATFNGVTIGGGGL